MHGVDATAPVRYLWMSWIDAQGQREGTTTTPRETPTEASPMAITDCGPVARLARGGPAALGGVSREIGLGRVEAHRGVRHVGSRGKRTLGRSTLASPRSLLAIRLVRDGIEFKSAH